MAYLFYDRVALTGLAAAVPALTVDNYAYTAHFPAEEVKEVVDKIGIRERRFAPQGMTASDLAFAAAEKLLEDLNIERSSIDGLIFVSQTPDYRMPATAVILQHRLGLPTSCMSFDMNLGCSAFVYGLSVAFGLVQGGGARRILLLDGETRSRVYSAKDRKTAFIFGDGAAAALVERSEEARPTWFSLHSDGSLESLIKINAGGYRNPSSAETVQERVVDEYGNIRTDEQGYMNGADVFNFVLREIPKDFKALLSQSQTSIEEIDYFLFHQANAYMNSYLAKKLKLPLDKAPSCLEYFGNTSSVSIPLTAVTELKGRVEGEKKLLLSGFGVGVSWASCVMPVKHLHISDLVEVENVDA